MTGERAFVAYVPTPPEEAPQATVNIEVVKDCRPLLAPAMALARRFGALDWPVIEWRVSPLGAQLLRRQIERRTGNRPEFDELVRAQMLGAPLVIDESIPWRVLRAVLSRTSQVRAL